MQIETGLGCTSDFVENGKRNFRISEYFEIRSKAALLKNFSLGDKNYYKFRNEHS